MSKKIHLRNEFEHSGELLNKTFLLLVQPSNLAEITVTGNSNFTIEYMSKCHSVFNQLSEEFP